MGNRSPVEYAPSSATESLSDLDDIMEMDSQYNETVSLLSSSGDERAQEPSAASNRYGANPNELVDPEFSGLYKFRENVSVN